MLQYFKDRTITGLQNSRREPDVNDDQFLNAALILNDYEGGHAHGHDDEDHGHGHKEKSHGHDHGEGKGMEEDDAEAKY